MAVLLDNVTNNAIGTALDCTDKEQALFFIEGDFDAEITFEASIDGSVFFSYAGALGASDTKTSRVKAPGYVVFNVKPITAIRPVVVNYKRGSVTVSGYAE